jgi:hypothetical protein
MRYGNDSIMRAMIQKSATAVPDDNIPESAISDVNARRDAPSHPDQNINRGHRSSPV